LRAVRTRLQEIHREYKISVAPRPDYPIDQSKPNVFNPDLWSKIPSSHIKYAFRLAVDQQFQSMKEYLYILRIRKRPNLDSESTALAKHEGLTSADNLSNSIGPVIKSVTSETKASVNSSVRSMLSNILSPEELSVIRVELSQGINSPRELFTNPRLKVVAHQIVQRYMIVVQEYINEFMAGYRNGVKQEEEAFALSRNDDRGNSNLK
jgi:hypothetical protein